MFARHQATPPAACQPQRKNAPGHPQGVPPPMVGTVRPLSPLAQSPYWPAGSCPAEAGKAPASGRRSAPSPTTARELSFIAQPTL